MANWYVWSGATGAGTGADWTNAFVSISSLSAKAAGDTFYIAHDHAQTQASGLTVVFPGTEAAPNRMLCVNRAGSVPPVSADLRDTATVSVTGAFSISMAGAVSECYGIIWQAGSSTSNGSLSWSAIQTLSWRFVNCSFRLLGNNASSRINICGNSNAGTSTLENCTVQFAHVSQGMAGSGVLFWRNTPSAILGATIPTELLMPSSQLKALLEGVDLSAIGVGKNHVRVTNTSGTLVIFKNCKLGAGEIAIGAPTGYASPEVHVIHCDSGDVNYRYEKWAYKGILTTETTIVRTGGASDGTTPVSWKIVTTANSQKELPFECLPITIWNETVGSAITVTIQGIWGGGSVPNNDDIWIDVQYLGTSGYPLSSKATCGKADSLASGAGLAAGSGTWGGSTTKFAMAATFTPQEKGPITIYVRAALASTTFYIDPKPVIT